MSDGGVSTKELSNHCYNHCYNHCRNHCGIVDGVNEPQILLFQNQFSGEAVERSSPSEERQKIWVLPPYIISCRASCMCPILYRPVLCARVISFDVANRVFSFYSRAIRASKSGQLF